ncbi:hypothetical protein KC343_g20446, partial [Hortaea werneckii]
MEDFFDTRAAEGSDEEEEFDEETGEAVDRPRKKAENGDVGDSSEEEDDDDEEAERQVREGFIVDEEEDDD